MNLNGNRSHFHLKLPFIVCTKTTILFRLKYVNSMIHLHIMQRCVLGDDVVIGLNINLNNHSCTQLQIILIPSNEMANMERRQEYYKTSAPNRRISQAKSFCIQILNRFDRTSLRCRSEFSDRMEPNKTCLKCKKNPMQNFPLVVLPLNAQYCLI